MNITNIIERKFVNETWAELHQKKLGLFSTTDRIRSKNITTFDPNSNKYTTHVQWSYVETGKPLNKKLNEEVNDYFKNK
jgi:hypothetical protein